jgi:hypothetical protein
MTDVDVQPEIVMRPVKWNPPPPLPVPFGKPTGLAFPAALV